MLPSLLPDDQRKTQEQGTSAMLVMVLCFFLVMMMWSAGNAKKGDPAGNNPNGNDVVDRPIVPIDDATSIAATTATTAASENATPVDGASSEADVEPPPTFVTLGSLDQKSPYKMLVSLTHRGAAVARIELADARYRDVQDLAGYLGQLFVEIPGGDWESPCVVQVVGDGTPAARAGVEVGDEIVALADRSTASLRDLRAALTAAKPQTTVELRVRRGDAEKSLRANLGFSPIDIVRPEITPRDYDTYKDLGGLRGHELGRSNPLSFRATLASVDDARLDTMPLFGTGDYTVRDALPPPQLQQELAGVALLESSWELVSSSPDEAVFRKRIPSRGLEMRKTYRLARAGEGDAYHLTLGVELVNIGATPRRVAYQLDGPTGLPLEGAWYVRKTGPGWGTYGIRDVVVRMRDGSPETVSGNLISHDAIRAPWIEAPLYIGVDSTYFQCTILPKMLPSGEGFLAQAFPVRVGVRPASWPVLTDVSVRLISRETTLKPGESFTHEYRVFAGPKRPAVLAQYGLGSTLSYGWFSWIVVPMLALLHTFHALGMNYGMAIICLTIVVRLVMFPMSRKMVLNTIKMQEIQPELAVIAEKYKDDLTARQQAQAALFRKHNFNPLSGCLGLFIQLPIFVALYKALSIDVELYGVPLFSKAVRWCTDLSAPDMLFDWSEFWVSMGWSWFNMGQGVFYLGPFFNLLPLLTVGLFLVQQWVMMPPPADEQQRLQRQVMNVMMIFFSFLFFKMPSGLCVYFIVSSLWGIAERQLMPKPSPAPAGSSGSDDDGRHSHEQVRQPRDKKPESKPRDTAPGGLVGWLRDIAEQAKKKGQFDKTQMRPHDNKRGKRKK